MRTLGRVVILSLFLTLCGCASLVVSRPSGGHASNSNMSAEDAGITNQINSALVREPGISSLDIYVSTHQGIVTLKGYVDSRQMKNRAGDIAASFNGVQSVRNQLRLK